MAALDKVAAVGIEKPGESIVANAGSSPFVEGRGPLLGQHGPSTVDGARVLARRGVHVPCLHHIHGGGDDRRAKPSPKCRHKVTGQVVCGPGNQEHSIC